MLFKNGSSKNRDLKASICIKNKHWRNNVACLLQRILQKQKYEHHDN